MDVDMIKQAERFGEFVKYYNAYYEFGKFKEALLSKNNQKTENTSLVKYLKKLLLQADSETPPGMDIVPSDKIYFRARKIEDIFDATEKGITFNDNSIISGYNYFESKERF